MTVNGELKELSYAKCWKSNCNIGMTQANN